MCKREVRFRRGVLLIVIFGTIIPGVRRLSAQTPNENAAAAMSLGEKQVIENRDTASDRYETDHLVLYIDKGILSSGESSQFANGLERMFVATAAYVRHRFDARQRGVSKPTYYLTDRAGISHVNGVANVFLFAKRVIPRPAIAIHETTHLLLDSDPKAPRNREDLSPEEEKRAYAFLGHWLPEGFADYVAVDLAPRLGLHGPLSPFLKGDKSTVDTEAREWLNDPRGRAVVPFVASHGEPDNLLADRENVAPPFYVLSLSFVKYLVEHTGVATVAQLYEKHSNGEASIEEDVKRITGTDLAIWRQRWLPQVDVNGRER
jgi:hypothetical protein